MKALRYSLVALLALTLSACHPDTCDTPFGLGGTIDITMPEFHALVNVGGALTVNRGHHGIFVTRTGISDFVAFECSCPNGCDVRVLPEEEWGNSVLTCPVCTSRFSSLNGMPYDGSATPCPLYEYSTDFDGQNLTIY